MSQVTQYKLGKTTWTREWGDRFICEDYVSFVNEHFSEHQLKMMGATPCPMQENDLPEPELEPLEENAGYLDIPDYKITDKVLARARAIKAKQNAIASERETEPGAYIVVRRMTLDEAIVIAEEELLKES